MSATTLQYSQRLHIAARGVSLLVLLAVWQRYSTLRDWTDWLTIGPFAVLLAALLLLPALWKHPSSLNFMWLLLTLILSSAEWVHVGDWIGPETNFTAGGALFLAQIACGIGIFWGGREEKAFGEWRRSATADGAVEGAS